MESFSGIDQRDRPDETDFMTMTRSVLTEQKKTKAATGELTQLLTSIQTACKIISFAVRKAGIMKLFGTAGEINVQGEEVKKLDVLSNHLFVNMVTSSYATCILVSEENENIIQVDAGKSGKYIVCFDPLDGSSNIDCLVSIGSIFAIFRKEGNDPPSVKDVLQPGNKVVAAGFALYGSATLMVISTGNGVNVFMLDPSIGEFILIDANVKIPARGNIYSVNESYEPRWHEGIREFVRNKKNPAKGKPYGARYIGSMVADVYRTIKYGGIFMYPAMDDAPKGKLRLMYECIPMAFIITQAGGMATNGDINILDIVPDGIHQRSPIFLGSRDDVLELQETMKKYT